MMAIKPHNSPISTFPASTRVIALCVMLPSIVSVGSGIRTQVLKLVHQVVLPTEPHLQSQIESFHRSLSQGAGFSNRHTFKGNSGFSVENELEMSEP